MGIERVFLLFGSNLGNREENIERAIEKIADRFQIDVQSSRYQTAPWGISNQPDFINQVVTILCDTSPEDLFQFTQSIEKELGRERLEKWGPRVIDIDILFYGNRIVSTNSLTIPHPRITERRFTLLPLCEVDRNFTHPVLHKSMAILLLECSDELPVKKL